MTRRHLGSSNADHLEQAERHLKEAYKHAAKIDTEVRKGDCKRVWEEIMSTYGAVRVAEAHLNSTTSRFESVGRVKQASNNVQGLYSRVMKSVESVGWQCTRRGGLSGLGRASHRSAAYRRRRRR